MARSKIGFVALVVVAAIALAANASAATITSDQYDGTLTASSEGNATLHMPEALFSDLECSWDLKADITTNGEGATASALVEELSITKCKGSNVPHVLSKGTLSISGANVLRGTGQEFSVTTSGGLTCIYKTNNTTLGTITDSGVTGGTATLDISATLPRTGGSHLCGSAGQWTGSFTFEALESSTDKLFIAGETSTTISSEPYDGKFTASTEEDHLTLHGSFGFKLECDWHIRANIAIDGSGTTPSAEVEELNPSGCTNGYAVHLLKEGTLTFDGNGDLGGINQTFNVTTPLGIECEYTTKSTKLGTITDSGVTGGTATVDLAAAVPRTGGSFLCGSTGSLTGSLTLEALQAETDKLYID